MQGISQEEAELRFKRAADFLQEEGWETESALDIYKALPANEKEEKSLLIGMQKLFRCDAIYLLTNWLDSTNSRIEFNACVLKNKNIYYEAYYNARTMTPTNYLPPVQRKPVGGSILEHEYQRKQYITPNN